MAVAEMPTIRINANIAMRKRNFEDSVRANQKLKLKTVDVRNFLSHRIDEGAVRSM